MLQKIYPRSKDKETVYFGYENEVPDDIKSFIITEIYIDWASEALGIRVSEKKIMFYISTLSIKTN